jgi:hypothetical protein
MIGGREKEPVKGIFSLIVLSITSQGYWMMTIKEW